MGPVSVTFDKPMNPATVTTSSLKLVAGTDCTAAGLAASGITASGGNTVFTINITASKTNGQQYTTCVSTAVQSVAGVAMAAPASATWTASDVIYSTGFEESSWQKTAYANGNAGPTGQQWELNNVLARDDDAGDRKNGTRSLRAQQSTSPVTATMLFDVTGVERVQFYYARYGTDTGTRNITLERSLDGGSTWSTVGSPIVTTNGPGSLTMATFNVSIAGPVRFRLNFNDAAMRINIDDFEIRATPAPPSVISSNPANGATNIGFNPSASVTFSEAMNVS
ncbi:MAG: Ig-like domain-containing protein, partial [Leptospiraceae bacterium]|nr:Ig-like domain-containing protein [Leptospiraceae bacterium]